MTVLRRGGLLEDDPEPPAVGEANAFAQVPRTAEPVQHAGDGAGILAQLSGLSLKVIDFLNDLYGEEDIVILELEQGIGIMEQDISVEDVVLFHARRI